MAELINVQAARNPKIEEEVEIKKTKTLPVPESQEPQEPQILGDDTTEMKNLVNSAEEESKESSTATTNVEPSYSTIEKPEPIPLRTSDYSSVMDALYMLKGGDNRMEAYRPLLFLTTMSYKESKQWISTALDTYARTMFKEGEPKSWPIARCLKVYVARKAKKAAPKPTA